MTFDKEISINGRVINQDTAPYIIAEAGVSHFGNKEKAMALCDLAKSAGSDSIKFQIFDVDVLISSISNEWKERLGPRQMSAEDYAEVKQYCDKIGITFFATAHDAQSLDKLVDIGVPVLKVGSGERKNLPFMEEMIAKNLPMIISLGMYSPEDVDALVAFLKEKNKTDVVLLHCVTQYPAAPEIINLETIRWIKERYDILSGYSDHTAGHHIAEASTMFGATVIEKHISLDFNVPNAQDWKVSCGPHDLETFCNNVRDIHGAIGRPGKFVSEPEKDNSAWATKGVYAARDIAPGETLTADMLVIKRPASDITPEKLHMLLGKTTTCAVAIDNPLKWSALSA